MPVGLESLVIVVAFIVPGFLTSKLIASKTPRRRIESSTFEDTAESILRSVYINLLVAALALLLYHGYFRSQAIPEIQQLQSAGPVKFGQNHPLIAIQVSLIWLAVAFAFATFFGAVWDPLYALMNRLSKFYGGLSEDAFALIRGYALSRRKESGLPSQVWIRARINSGTVYQGEFVFASFKEPGQDRELLLTNVSYLQQDSTEKGDQSDQRLDFVLIELSSGDSIEFKFSDLTNTRKFD